MSTLCKAVIYTPSSFLTVMCVNNSQVFKSMLSSEHSIDIAVYKDFPSKYKGNESTIATSRYPGDIKNNYLQK